MKMTIRVKRFYGFIKLCYNRIIQIEREIVCQIGVKMKFPFMETMNI